MSKCYVDVAVPLGVRKTFAYSMSPGAGGPAAVGARVLVPFGRKLISGFVVGVNSEAPPGDFRIRPIQKMLDPAPVIPEKLVHLALWIADYYFTAPGEALRLFLPLGGLASGDRRVSLDGRTHQLISGGLRPPGLSSQELLLLETLAAEGSGTVKALSKRDGLRDVGQWLEALALKGLIHIEEFVEPPRVEEKTELGACARPAAREVVDKLAPSQKVLYDHLARIGSTTRLKAALEQAGVSRTVAGSLEKKGLIEIAPLRIDRVPVELSEIDQRKELVLTDAQCGVLQRLRGLLTSGQAARCLLHGVTGSGKTEVYLRLIADVLSGGGTAILLVPEIGLTPLLSRIAASHFPNRIALLHSGMSDGERFDQWHRIRSGAAPVVVGTRSAVFAPLENLRLIVLDEEQDASYKQDESPGYHARDVAWQRLRGEGGVLLMGSATPSVETYQLAQDPSSVVHLTLPQRIESRPLPEVTVVDMSVEFQRHGRDAVLSETLCTELGQNLVRGEQSIVLLNRRGYSRSLLCRSCGNVFSCSDCSIPMTYHQKEDRLICHYCGLRKEKPEACDRCGKEFIYFVGVGTEQLEEIMRAKFPRARLTRVDRDTTRRRGSLRRILMDFASRKIDILVGTQMLAKGHDFPDVTLVGVVSADAGLSFPDFRAAERTFQLLTQVSGRAGRGNTPGRVVVQAFYPNHYAIQCARRQDYCGFFSREIEFRRLLGYPPFRDLVQILITAADAEKGLRIGDRIAAAVKAVAAHRGAKSRIQVLGPAAAPLEKLRGEYRFQVLLKSARGVGMSAILQDAFAQLAHQKVPMKSVHVDVDPLSML